MSKKTSSMTKPIKLFTNPVFKFLLIQLMVIQLQKYHLLKKKKHK